jgi:KamA family protein
MYTYKNYTLRNYREIEALKKLNKIDYDAIEIVGNVLPFKTNNYVVENLIDWGNIPEDPIFTLTFPRKEMLQNHHYSKVEKMFYDGLQPDQMKPLINDIRHELNPHPAGQKHNVPQIDGVELTGVQHKYRETVLFFPSQGQTCHAYCTFCFRWPQFVGMADMKFAMKEVELLTKYLKAHREVTDVLFTGGDPLIMSTKRLAFYIDELLDDDLYNIQTIRFGTKALAYWPYRFTKDEDADELIKLFDKIIAKGKNLAIMAHFNHPIELSTEAVKEAVKRIRATGAQIRTQSPVMKHINDKPEIWGEMWRKQVNLSCIPYYMFVARDTGAQHFFGMPLVEAWNIFRKAYQSVSGVCRTVRGPSMSATPGKIQVLGVSEVNKQKLIVMRFLQGRNPDWVARPFFAEFNENAIWLDELKPAFGEDKFFFEEELETIFNEHVYDDESQNFE